MFVALFYSNFALSNFIPEGIDASFFFSDTTQISVSRDGDVFFHSRTLCHRLYGLFIAKECSNITNDPFENRKIFAIIAFGWSRFAARALFGRLKIVLFFLFSLNRSIVLLSNFK